MVMLLLGGLTALIVQAIGIGVMGAAVLLFLIVAIGRNLRDNDERAEEAMGPTDASARETAGADASNRDVWNRGTRGWVEGSVRATALRQTR